MRLAERRILTFSEEKKDKEDDYILDKKCCKRRGVKDCRACCRYKYCKTKTPYPVCEEGAIRLVGACIWSALEDCTRPIKPLAQCKNKSQIIKRNNDLHNRATAENFFKSRLFKLTQLDMQYLLEAHKREIRRIANEETQIPKRRYRGCKVEKH